MDEIETARKTAAGILAKAADDAADIRTKAHADAEDLLRETKIWVAERDRAFDGFLFGWIGRSVCHGDSRVGAILDVMLGSAKACYCCAAIRGTVIGLLVGSLFGAIVALALAHGHALAVAGAHM